MNITILNEYEFVDVAPKIQDLLQINIAPLVAGCPETNSTTENRELQENEKTTIVNVIFQRPEVAVGGE